MPEIHKSAAAPDTDVPIPLHSPGTAAPNISMINHLSVSTAFLPAPPTRSCFPSDFCFDSPCSYSLTEGFLKGQEDSSLLRQKPSPFYILLSTFYFLHPTFYILPSTCPRPSILAPCSLLLDPCSFFLQPIRRDNVPELLGIAEARRDGPAGRIPAQFLKPVVQSALVRFPVHIEVVEHFHKG